MQPVEAPLIQNNPGFGHRKLSVHGETKSYTSWIVGGIVALAVLFVFISMYRHNNNYTASYTNPNAPAVTTTAPAATPPSTTGSAVPTAPAAR
jgi:hypothetical protein